MGKILKVSPGSGKAGDHITILLAYDKKVDNPQVTHVVFHDNAEAPDVEEKEHDKANRNILISVEVPRNAETGPIEVNLEGEEGFSTAASFRIEQPQKEPFKVTQLRPTPTADGYEQGWNLWISTSRTNFYQTPKVYFPRTSYGPPSQAGRILGTTPGVIKVVVPNRSQSGSIKGRIKVQDGDESALTRVLMFR
jgi:hypothetical protein